MLYKTVSSMLPAPAGKMPYMDLGGRIQERRKELKKSVRALADVCGVTPQAVYQWERGDTKNLKLINLVHTVEFLRTTMRWLVTGRGAKEFRGTPLEPDEAELLASYTECTPD